MPEIPGDIFLCPNGHVVGYIQSGLHWNDELVKKQDDLKKKACPKCGKVSEYDIIHYGQIDNCFPFKLDYDFNEERWIIPVNNPNEVKEFEQFKIIKEDISLKSISEDQNQNITVKNIDNGIITTRSFQEWMRRAVELSKNWNLDFEFLRVVDMDNIKK